ncbi:MAG TPA: bacillithiol biosynthesis deacetylase BshB1 [Chitinophagales bacterium]|nr:bacillithiol biosynthesis deacetylase BshB1 [Chitinophagales bacterium]HRK27962.1 bacillithiol biosynthesis deacetylase BshB1 [Chitinophagales bacterium]
MKLDILAIGVHPDDIELSCGGTVAAHIAAGKTVGLLDLTKGELGTRGSEALRQQEAKEAAHILGATLRLNLGFADGFFTNDKHHKLALIAMLRAYQPDVVLAPALHDRHPDHGRAARLVAETCFLAGLSKIVTHNPHNGQEQTPWRPQNLYHYLQDSPRNPHFVVDISDFMDKKIAAIMAYGSQFYNPKYQEQTGEAATYISEKSFLDRIYARNLEMARQTPFTYAEGFETTRIIAVNSLFDIC